jgi:hypothetical protein
MNIVNVPLRMTAHFMILVSWDANWNHAIICNYGRALALCGPSTFVARAPLLSFHVPSLHRTGGLQLQSTNKTLCFALAKCIATLIIETRNNGDRRR